MSEVEFLEAMQVLELKPGDIIVLKHGGRLPEIAHRRIRESFQHIAPFHKVIILEEGMEIGVLREDVE
jgi:hypothetical protein